MSLIFIIFSLLYPLQTVSSFEGPLQIKNLYPIFLHANQPYLEKAAMESSMSYSLSHSSTYTVKESGNWTINLDMEITEFNFRYKRIIQEFFEFGMDIPVLVLGSGFIDGFLEDYHDTFGFSDYGRSERPKNEFLYSVEKDSELIIQGKSGVRLNDIRLTAKKTLILSDNFSMGIKGDIEFPISDAKKGFSNGSVDAGISVLLDKRISDRTMTYWNFGVVFPGDVRGHEKIDLDNFVYGGGAVERVIGKSISLLAQLMVQSSLYPSTGISEVDTNGILFAFGGRYQMEKRIFELSLTEDFNTSGAPDFILNFTYKLVL